MSITIVSSLPKSLPAQAEASSATEPAAGAVQGFASLLLGQLAGAIPAGGTAVAAALESVIGEASGKDADEDVSTAATDPLALLATLAQVPVEQRNEVVPSGDIPSADGASLAKLPGIPAAHAAAVDGSVPEASARQMEQTVAAPAAEGQRIVPAGEPAAKFAVPAAASFERTTSTTETTELRAVTNEAPAHPLAAHAANVHADKDAPEAVSIPTPLRDRTWNNDFAQKVVWIATGHKQAAELTLNPPAMGSIEISLHLDKDRSTASATFVSANAEVRETIETALPRLREMLAGVGIQLGQANVSAESFRQASGNGSGASQSGNDNAILGPDLQASRSVGRGVAQLARGLVDTFA